MNNYVKSFLHRGLIFGGLGPVILGIIFFCIDASLPDFSLSGKEVLIGIISTYLLAFIHAGASIFNQIERWSIAKSLLFHFLTLYIAYVFCYAVNSWIPFDPAVILLFSAIFVLSYFIVWLTVYLIVKRTQRSLNFKITN